MSISVVAMCMALASYLWDKIKKPSAHSQNLLPSETLSSFVFNFFIVNQNYVQIYNT